MQVVAVTNFKGGSGKTTTSAHLAQYLALQGYRVLAVDLDPQASLSALLGVLPETDVGANETLYAAIRYDDTRRPLRDVIRPTYFDGLHLVPGNLELMEFEHTTPKALTDKGTRDGLFFTRVAQAFDEVADDYDVVVIDCPPQLGFLTLSGLCAATSMVITVHPQMLDIASMSQFLLMTRDLLGVVKEAGGNLQYDFIRYLLTRYEPQDAPQTKVTALLRNMFEDHVLTNPMVKSAAVSDAGLTKQTLYEIGRENLTRSTYDRAMEIFRCGEFGDRGFDQDGVGAGLMKGFAFLTDLLGAPNRQVLIRPLDMGHWRSRGNLRRRRTPIANWPGCSCLVLLGAPNQAHLQSKMRRHDAKPKRPIS